MSAKLTNLSGVEDSPDGWHTYYIRITVDGRRHYKLGMCKGLVRKRYSKEPSTTAIDLLKLWIHESEQQALAHESQLFKQYPGDQPYIGRCGPLRHGGNTETYSHDVVAGEPPPHRYTVMMLSDEHIPLYTYGYSGANPKEPYRHLYGEVKYMDYSFGPEDSYLQVPHLSHPDAVTLATYDYLVNQVEHYRARRAQFLADKFQSAINYCLFVSKWTDHSRMRFESLQPFTVEQWANWV